MNASKVIGVLMLTALVATPFWFSYKSGHIKAALQGAAIGLAIAATVLTALYLIFVGGR